MLCFLYDEDWWKTSCFIFVKNCKSFNNWKIKRLYERNNGEKIIPTKPKRSPKNVKAINFEYILQRLPNGIELN